MASEEMTDEELEQILEALSPSNCPAFAQAVGWLAGQPVGPVPVYDASSAENRNVYEVRHGPVSACAIANAGIVLVLWSPIGPAVRLCLTGTPGSEREAQSKAYMYALVEPLMQRTARFVDLTKPNVN